MRTTAHDGLTVETEAEEDTFLRAHVPPLRSAKAVAALAVRASHTFSSNGAEAIAYEHGASIERVSRRFE